MMIGDGPLDRRFGARSRETEKSQSAEPFEVLADIERIDIGLELLIRNLAGAGREVRVRDPQQRNVEVDAAFDAVQRIVGRRLELDPRRVLGGEIGKRGHCQAGDGHCGEGDDGKVLLQSTIRISCPRPPLSTLGCANTMPNSTAVHRFIICPIYFAG